MNSKIRFTKTRDVKSPSYRVGDAGTDFYVPNNTKDFLDALLKKNIEELDNDIWVEGDDIVVGPHSQVLIPCGIKVDILDKNTYLDAENKSGIATKKELLVGAQVVDAIYQGEVHINLHNVSNRPQRIGFGTKAVQFLHKEYIQTVWEEISNEEYNNIETSLRGEGGFSSTGLN